MINFHRTACVKSGMMTEAMAVAREFIPLMKSVAGLDVRLQLPIGGNPWRLRWTIQYTDLNAMNAANAKLMANPDYTGLLAKVAQYLISGASTDDIWNVV